MGRHHNSKFPDHLYISPPSPQTSPVTSFASAVSVLSLKSTSYSSPAALIQETSSTALAVGDKIPGFRISAAFFTTLRANINLDLEIPDSQLNTPDSLRPTALTSSVSSLLPSSGLNMADSDFAPPAALAVPKAVLSTTDDDTTSVDVAVAEDPNAIPELTTILCDEDPQRIEALKLVADSVAQQRQLTSRTLIFHPITLTFLVAVGAFLYQYFHKGERSDWAIIATTFAGVVMSVFAIVRAAAGPYLEEAERVGTWVWLDTGRTKKAEEETGKAILGISDEIFLTKFGSEPIGAIIFRGIQPSSTAASPKKTKKSTTGQSSATGTKTEIRGWSVRQKYRHKGVGTALLEDAIKKAYENGWTSAGIEFAADHANSKRVLPPMFNGALEKREQKARALLQQKVEAFETANEKGSRRKR